MENRHKYIYGYLNRDSIYQEIYPLRDAAFDADCIIFPPTIPLLAYELTLLLPRGWGSSRPSKGFFITFEQNNLETSNFAEYNFNNIYIRVYDQI